MQIKKKVYADQKKKILCRFFLKKIKCLGKKEKRKFRRIIFFDFLLFDFFFFFFFAFEISFFPFGNKSLPG